MPRPYSNDLRERVVRSVANGASCRQAAAQFEVSVSFVVKLMQRWRARGSVAPDRFGGGRTSPLAAHADKVRGLVAADSDITIEKLRGELAHVGIVTSRSAMGRFLLALGLTRKKRLRGQPSRSVRTSPGPAPTGSPGRRDCRQNG